MLILIGVVIGFLVLQNYWDNKSTSLKKRQLKKVARKLRALRRKRVYFESPPKEDSGAPSVYSFAKALAELLLKMKNASAAEFVGAVEAALQEIAKGKPSDSQFAVMLRKQAVKDIERHTFTVLWLVLPYAFSEKVFKSMALPQGEMREMEAYFKSVASISAIIRGPLSKYCWNIEENLTINPDSRFQIKDNGAIGILLSPLKSFGSGYRVLVLTPLGGIQVHYGYVEEEKFDELASMLALRPFRSRYPSQLGDEYFEIGDLPAIEQPETATLVPDYVAKATWNIICPEGFREAA